MKIEGERPVLVIGHGCRAAGVDVAPLLELGLPVLTSWQAKDMVDNFHPNYLGSPGVYGNRTANKVLYEADTIYSFGCRLSVPMIGHSGLRPEQRLFMVDCDEKEIANFPQAQSLGADIGAVVSSLEVAHRHQWRLVWHAYKRTHPIIELAHDDTDYINSYRFTERLQAYFRPDEVIVTDMGTALICAHQVLRLKPPQRLMTSGGLGEMGVALPAAIGASFARGKGEVLCLHCDGGMMMNLQELATIRHHNLPIKIIVYENDGYLMIKRSQKVLGMKAAGVDRASGVSLPDFHKVAMAFDIAVTEIKTWDEFNKVMPQLFAYKGPAMVVYHMAADQPLVPKLDPIMVDGKPTAPRFDQMSPVL